MHFQPRYKDLKDHAFTRNWDGVSSVLKSEEEEIPSSRVSKNTFWKSNISGRLPNKDSICMKIKQEDMKLIALYLYLIDALRIQSNERCQILKRNAENHLFWVF